MPGSLLQPAVTRTAVVGSLTPTAAATSCLWVPLRLWLTTAGETRLQLPSVEVQFEVSEVCAHSQRCRKLWSLLVQMRHLVTPPTPPPGVLASPQTCSARHSGTALASHLEGSCSSTQIKTACHICSYTGPSSDGLSIPGFVHNILQQGLLQLHQAAIRGLACPREQAARVVRCVVLVTGHSHSLFQ
jgi:hypothetical protein